MTIIEPGQPAAAPPAAPEAPKDYQALYEIEVAERTRERERYKPFAQSIGTLPPDQQAQILALGRAAADGDQAAILEWAEGTYRNLTGAEIAAKVAASTTGTPPPAAAGDPAPAVTAEQIAEMVRTHTDQAMRRESMTQQITSELAAAGFPPGTPAGQTIIGYAQQQRASIADAVAWYTADLPAQYARHQQALAGVAGATPPPAPGGAPAGALPGATSAQKAIARLTASQG